jgi:hypothetical protein
LLRTLASSPLLEAVLESNRLRAGELANEARMALSSEPKSKTQAPAPHTNGKTQEAIRR